MLPSSRHAGLPIDYFKFGDEANKKFEFDFAGSGQHNPLTF